MQRSVLLTIIGVVLVALVATTTTATGSRRSALLADGYVEEASLFHRILRKGSHQVDLPYHNREINMNWLAHHMQRARKTIDAEARASNSTGPVLHDSYWDFVPLQMGTTFTNKPLGWQDSCFETLSATLNASSSVSGSIEIQAGKKQSALCNSFYMFCTRESCHLSLIELVGKHTIEMQWREYEYADVTQHGVFVFWFPLGLERSLVSLVKTVSLFYDPYKGMVNANVQFLAEKLEWALVERQGYNTVTNISESDIKSGDYLAIGRLDGLDPLVMWGTGGHTGHTAIALWFDGELYICESTDTEGGKLVYWPPPYGIIRTPWKQWVQQAMAANYHVAILRLAPQYLSLFNETAANQWFYTVQGMPYGWHNFIFTFFDTVADNLPRPVTPDLVEVVAGVAERIIPIGSKSSIYSMVIMALNQRLGSNCTTLNCIYSIIDPQNRTLCEVATIPEQDAWRYDGNYSMVCDVFVCEMYKNAGIFGNLTNNFQCTEQTPKDTYQWQIWDANWRRPQACIARDPQLPYCQLMGKYVLSLPGYNSLAPYANMNNYCPSVPPVYYRPAVC